jgi:aryl-alcohol dehydrogenase-like predicted oxidoreductase
MTDVDAALIYGNQDEVGQGIKASGVPREQVFVTSKVREMVLQGLGVRSLIPPRVHFSFGTTPIAPR